MYNLTRIVSLGIACVQVTMETLFQRSFHCAMLAAGSSIEMVEQIMHGKVRMLPSTIQ